MSQPTDKQEIVKTEPLHIFMRRPDVIEQFIGLFPDDQAAKRYVQSVLILVQCSEPGEYSLQNCSNESILRSALRAATLRVSVDPAVRQAWLVPRNNKKTGKLEAGLQLHYSEVRNRAMRTNRYWFINVAPVYEGCEVFENIYSGLHQVKLPSGLMTAPSTQDGFVPISERRGKVIGYLGYMKTTKGAEQTAYMSVDDIEKYVSRYNPYWTSSKAWKNNRQTMEMKTVLTVLLKKADLGDPDMAEVKEILSESDERAASPDETILDGQLSAMDDDQDGAQTIGNEVYLRACEMLTPRGTRFEVLTDNQLQAIVESVSASVSSEMKQAARIVIEHRINQDVVA